MNRSDSIANLATALAVAQASIAPAAKDKVNPGFKSRYADLASVWDACRAALTENGLSVVQLPAADGQRVTVTTILAHKSGEWLSSELTMTAQAATPQAVGSAITYARRYALSAMVSVAPDDDDGNEASGRSPPQQRSPAPESVSRPPPPSGGAHAPASGTQSKPNEADLAKAVAQRQVEDEQIAVLVRESLAAKTQRELDAVAEKVKSAPERVRAEVRPVWVAQMKSLSEQKAA